MGSLRFSWVQYVWLVIIAVSAAPLVYVAWLLNPLFFLLLGPEWWVERMAKLRPHRWRIAFLAAVFVSSLTIYLIRYA